MQVGPGEVHGAGRGVALGRLGPRGWSLTLAGSLTLSHTQNCDGKFRPTTWRVLGTGPDVLFLNRSSLDSQISPTRTDTAGSSPSGRRRRKREAAACQSRGLRIPWARPRLGGAQVSANSGSAPRQLQAAGARVECARRGEGKPLPVWPAA